MRQRLHEQRLHQQITLFPAACTQGCGVMMVRRKRGRGGELILDENIQLCCVQNNSSHLQSRLVFLRLPALNPTHHFCFGKGGWGGGNLWGFWPLLMKAKHWPQTKRL